VRDYLKHFGFPEPLPPNPSLALGTTEVTLLELVRAYSVLAAQGRRSSPVFITKVTDTDGHPLPFRGTDPNFEHVVDPAVAYMLTDMMETVVSKGTGRRAADLGRPVAGKTGTTNEGRDAWFVGFTPDLIAGVWVGFDSQRSLGREETGGHAAAPIWTDFMRYALEDRPVHDFPIPDGVTLVRIDPWSGLRAPDGMPGKLEPFVTGSEPTRWATPPEPEPDDDYEPPYEPPSEPELYDGYTRMAAPTREP
jgi:penicillin-binding protein 1A